MIAIVIVLLVLLALVAGLAFLLGFRIGGEHWLGELTRVRMEAADAERQLHHLTREAFMAMAEHAQSRRTDRP